MLLSLILWAMARTRAFKSGNSQAVRLPADIAYEENAELEVTRTGDVTLIFPARGSIKDAVEMLQQMPKLKHMRIPRTLTRKTRWD